MSSRRVEVASKSHKATRAQPRWNEAQKGHPPLPPYVLQIKFITIKDPVSGPGDVTHTNFATSEVAKSSLIGRLGTERYIICSLHMVPE